MASFFIDVYIAWQSSTIHRLPPDNTELDVSRKRKLGAFPNLVKQNTNLVVEFYGLVNYVLVALLVAQVLAPTCLDKPLPASEKKSEEPGTASTSNSTIPHGVYIY